MRLEYNNSHIPYVSVIGPGAESPDLVKKLSEFLGVEEQVVRTLISSNIGHTKKADVVAQKIKQKLFRLK